MSAFGDNLRHEREARSISLDDISGATKISVRLLRAIENEEFDRLPGGVFNVNFVRQYARHLGLDEDKIVGEFRRLSAPMVEAEDTPQRAAIIPDDWSDRTASEYQWDRERQSRTRIIVTLVVAVLGLSAGLYLWLSGRKSPPVAAPGVSAPAAPTVPAPVATSVPDPMTEPPPAGPKPAPAVPVSVSASAPATSASPVASPPAASKPAADPTPVPAAPEAATDAAVRVEIRATDTVWVAATADGQMRFQGVLQPQQTRIVTAQLAVRLRVGDAAALALTLNGQPQPAVGAKGQVKTVVLTPQGMRVMASSPKEALPENAPNAEPDPRQTDPKSTAPKPLEPPPSNETAPAPERTP